MTNLINTGNTYLQIKILEEIIGLVFVVIALAITAVFWIKEYISYRKTKKVITEQQRKREIQFEEFRKKFK